MKKISGKGRQFLSGFCHLDQVSMALGTALAISKIECADAHYL